MSEIIQKKTQKYTVIFSFLLLFSILSGVIVFMATTNGPLGYSDSVAYLVSARNLIKGYGLGMFMPSGRFVITYLHPPLYSLLLSGIGLLGVDLVDAARWCNIVLSALTVFTTGYLFLRHSQIPELAIVSGLLTFLFPGILTMFTSAMSETLFLFLLSLSCLLLLNYLQKQTTTSLITAAIFCGLLPVTRYVGASIIISAMICVYLFSAGRWKERLKRSIGFGLLSVLPLVIWFAALSAGPGRVLGGRSIQIDGKQLMAGIFAYWNAVVEILWSWIPFSKRSLFQFLHPVRGIMMAATFLVVSAVTWMAGGGFAGQGGESKRSDIQISVFYVIATSSYFFVFMASWLFTVPQTPINDRLLMPLYFTVLLGLLGCMAVWQGAVGVRTRLLLRIVPWLFVMLMTYWYFPQVIDVINQSYKNDTALAYRWRDSQVIRGLKALPSGQIIISNKSETVILWADRPAYDLMEYLPAGFVRQNSPYGSDDSDAAQKIFRQGAALVIFNDFMNQFESTYGSHGKERLSTIFDGLTVAGQYPDGTIYLYPAK